MSVRLPSLRISTLDFKVGLRMLARYPGLSIVGTVAIAVGIALGSLYFELLDKWQNPRLPVADAGRIVAIHNWDVNATTEERRVLHDYALWRAELRTIDHVGAAITFVRNLATDDGRVEPVPGAEITANAFQLLGTTPVLGRALTEQDQQPSQPPVVVIGEAVWKNRFASDPHVLGRKLKLGTTTATIVGVMPVSFGFPVKQRIWTPLQVDAALLAPRSGPAVSVFGRLAPGASMDDARAELSVVGARVSAADPETHKYLRARVTNYGKPFLEGGQALVIKRLLYVVNGIFLMLLSIVCVNVATLVFARTATRGWEITVRTALGASRGRIIGQLFIEALVLAAAAAVVGLLITKIALHWGLGLAASNDSVPYWINDGLSWRTILYAAGLTLVGAAIVGILPALRVTRVNIQDALRSESAATSGLRFGGFWTTVIVVQVAFTVLLLPLAAGGVFESNRFNQRAEGIGADHYLTAKVAMDQEDARADSAAFLVRGRLSYDELERRLRAQPGVEAVAFADRLPVMDQFKYNIDVDTTMGIPSTTLRRSTVVQTSGGFFAAFGTSAVAGREFTPGDFENGHVIVVNQSFVKYVLGGRNAIGQRVRIVSGEDSRVTSKDWYEIVGVVKDFGWQLQEPQEQSAIYRPRLPAPAGSDVNIAIRVRDPNAFAPHLRSIAAEVDPTIRLTEVQPLTDVGGGEAKSNWTLTWVAWVVSLVVLILSATGIHALMSFTVTRRTREIGIRVALGASPKRIVAGIFSRSFLQIGIGVIAGTALAALFGLGSMRAVLILVAADSVMLLAGLIACAIPLRRALSIDPTEALRSEG
jgi:putative ABC transport system permease protein